MPRLRSLALIAFLFGFSTGLVNTAAPQAAVSLHLSSFEIGTVGACNPAGYALSCVLFGMLLASVPLKRVLLAGLVGAAVAVVWMSTASGASSLIAGHCLFGVTSAAIWPFVAAWMLDLESPSISKTTILRHYNVAWTGGTASGMLAGGQLCSRTWILQAFYASAAVSLATFVLALLIPPARHRESSAMEAGPESAPAAGVHASACRVTLAMLIAAMLFNLSAIGTKLLIFVNYVELNALNQGDAGRMGLFLAVGTLSQLFAFVIGKFYEPYVGTRRVYAAGALLLVSAALAFAKCSSMWILLPAVAATGFVLAVAFQCAIFAFTARASSPRNGPVYSEALIGLAGLAPLAAGFLTDRLKASGTPAAEALRAPFYAAIALIAVALITQLLCAAPNAANKKNR